MLRPGSSDRERRVLSMPKVPHRPRLAALTVLLASCAAAALVLAPSSARSIPLQQASEYVNCHDDVRDIVSLKPQFECDGRIVTDAEAEAIRARRVQRVRSHLKAPEQAVPDKTLKATGTGFYVNPRGAIVTNHHVVANCSTVTATGSDGAVVQAEVVAVDEGEDLALLKIARDVPVAASFRQGALPRSGSKIAVIGFPLHGRVTIKPIFATGQMVHDPAMLRPVPGRFPLKADIRRGNSGGPVIDDSGLVVGVVTAKVNTPEVFERTGQLVRDIGLAIDISTLREFLKRNTVEFRELPPQPPLVDNALFARAQTYVARIGCWQ
jgi:S1-C subfamily serine protease